MLSGEEYMRFLPILALLAVAACSAPEPAAWTLDPAASRIEFSSTKNGDIVETHGFAALSGEVLATGEAGIVIDLASVATNIDIRDERMREHLFEVASFPSANVTALLDPAAYEALTVGDPAEHVLDASLLLHGLQQDLSVDVIVMRLDENRVRVESAGPITLHAGDFELEAGLETLRELAGLDAISPEVPVEFVLEFAR